MDEKPTQRRRDARGRVGEVVRSDAFRAYGPGLAATTVLLTMMFGLRWFA